MVFAVDSIRSVQTYGQALQLFRRSAKRRGASEDCERGIHPQERYDKFGIRKENNSIILRLHDTDCVRYTKLSGTKFRLQVRSGGWSGAPTTRAFIHNFTPSTCHQAGYNYDVEIEEDLTKSVMNNLTFRFVQSQRDLMGYTTNYVVSKEFTDLRARMMKDLRYVRDIYIAALWPVSGDCADEMPEKDRASLSAFIQEQIRVWERGWLCLLPPESITDIAGVVVRQIPRGPLSYTKLLALVRAAIYQVVRDNQHLEVPRIEGVIRDKRFTTNHQVEFGYVGD